MTGPYPPPYGAGPAGPHMYPETYPQQGYPTPAQPYPAGGIGASYPGTLPPPVPYPKRSRKPWIAISVAAVAILAVVGVITAVALSGGREEQAATGALTDASAQVAIQDYLDALSSGDDERVARHTLCGLFDAVKERRSDLALAGLSSDAFRKQYEEAEVTSIDKMVLSSPTQAQVLFTMRVIPASGSSRNQPQEADEQAVAQLISIDNEILVCSYLPRTAGQY
ncbi:hypothetical protein [Mycobacterium sp. 236(2023)]|uniref:Rv0361 family membrane protein n=1 Tax=Mycobacterium sp. 236(2023) TaxID=3038163 RepID=UPI0024154FF0|nr:hypothetical protein [Mycobacterium sp. 236(2023)]MDG4666425.1 hypothetical protein [Mycobacterium sp. 236(2023)]